MTASLTSVQRFNAER